MQESFEIYKVQGKEKLLQNSKKSFSNLSIIYHVKMKKNTTIKELWIPGLN